MTKIIFLLFIFCITAISALTQVPLCVNETNQLVAPGNPALVDPWVSSEPSIASVDVNGLVLAISPGTSIVTFTDEFGITTDFIQHVLVTPIISLSAVSNPTNCVEHDGSIQFTCNIEDGYYFWELGYFQASSFSTTISNLAPQTYTIWCTNGCDSNPITVTLSYPVINAPTVTVDGPLQICYGDSVTLTSSSLTDNRWNTGDSTQSIVVTSSGNYSVAVTDGICSSQHSSSIYVTEYPEVPLAPYIILNGPTTFCEGGFVALISSEPYGNTWSNGEIGQVIYVDSSGEYSVSIGYGNCLMTSNAEIVTVLNCLSLEEETQTAFTVYPNPISGVFYLKSENIESVRSVVLHDAIGRIVNVYFDITETTIFDLSEYAEGMYTISIKGDDFENIQKVQLIK